MPSYSKSSQARLTTCTMPLQKLFTRIVEWYDNTVLVGHRGREDQEAAATGGRSKVHYPNSKHNVSPSKAIDVGPYIVNKGVPWPQVPDFIKSLSAEDRSKLAAYIKDTAQFYHFAGAVEATAHELGINIRWGGDWDRDHCFTDQTFDDLVHFEEYESVS